MKPLLVCPVCDGTSFNFALNCKDFTVSHETFNINECTTCKFKVTSPLPENLDKYYLSDSYISHSSKASSLVDGLYILARNFTLKWKLRLITRYQKESGISILDFGCGTGDFLKRCKKEGLVISGVEPSDNARNLARTKTGGTIASRLSDLQTQRYEVITLWHVLEHIPTLNETLQTLSDKLTDSGTMFIAVPNHKSYDSSLYLTYWAGYDVPRHLWHFSQTNMESLLRKHNLKLADKIPMKLDAYYISLMSEKNKNNGQLTLTSFIRALFAALKSNLQASQSKEYSSIIYVIRK
ncbi:MAG: methyltransferase [Marivirga sp.]|nr:methyltransferase [Marivirga sp.]